MLHWISQCADWLHETVFNGGSLPGWMKRKMPSWVDAAILFLCSVAIATSVLIVTDVLNHHWSLQLLLALSVVSVWRLTVVPLGSRFRIQWLNRHERIWFYQPVGTAEGDLSVKCYNSTFSPEEAGKVLCSFPLSRTFGAPPEFPGIHIPTDLTIRWLKNDKYQTFLLRWYGGKIKITMHMIALFAHDRMQSVQVLDAFWGWHRNRTIRLREEIEQWLTVLEKSKRAAGSQELGALAARMRAVNVRMHEFCFDLTQAAPPLIMPAPKERGGGKATAT